MKNESAKLITNIILLVITSLLLMTFMWVFINTFSQQIDSLKKIQQLDKEISMLQSSQITIEYSTKPKALNNIKSNEVNTQIEVKLKKRNALEAKQGWVISILVSFGIWVMGIISARVIGNFTDAYFYPTLLRYVDRSISRNI